MAKETFLQEKTEKKLKQLAMPNVLVTRNTRLSLVNGSILDLVVREEIIVITSMTLISKELCHHLIHISTKNHI